MKKHLLRLACLLLLPLGAFGQGDINPADPPGPTMKSLDQIEPRRPISTLPFTISEPGSYYLTRNLTGKILDPGLTVTSDNVTVDLNGFTLFGVAGSNFGIYIPKIQKNIAVCNGVIRNWGAAGISASGLSNSQFEKLRVSNNGGSGINLFGGVGGVTIKDCVMSGNATAGLTGSGLSVIGCTARFNGTHGMDVTESTIRSCTLSNNTSIGIIAGFGSVVTDCVAKQNGVWGISVVRSTVTHSVASANGSNGIEALNACFLLNNTCDGNGPGAPVGAGIHVSGSGSRIEANNTSDNDIGIQVVNAGNIIIKNSSRGGTDAYDIATGNSMGQEINVFDPNATTIINTSNSWANFLY